MLDGSRSMLPANFNLTIKFVKDFVNSIEDLGPELIQIGVVSICIHMSKVVLLRLESSTYGFGRCFANSCLKLPPIFLP